MEIEETCEPKYFEETVRLQSEIRREWIREIRGERLQGIAEGAGSAPRLASSSAVSFPGRSECPGTHCSLIEQEEREIVPAKSAIEFEIRGKMEERTGSRGQNESPTGGEEKRNGRLYGAAETSKERAEWRRVQRKNLNILGLPKRKEWPQCHRESSWQERRSRLCQKEKEQSPLSRVPDHEEGESQDGQEPPLARKRGIRARAWSKKGGLHGERGQVPMRRLRASKTNLPRTSRRKHERMSGRNSSPGRSEKSWFHSKSGQTSNRKEGRETKSLLIRKKSEVSQSDTQGS